MSAKSKRFADRVKSRMVAVNKRTHDKIEAAGGPSSPTMTKILSGQSVALNSLEKLEKALDLVPGSAAVSLENDTELTPLSGSVSGGNDDGDTLLYKRPEAMAIDEWRAIVARTRNLVEWEIEQALREN